jgi:hypothetical protein
LLAFGAGAAAPADDAISGVADAAAVARSGGSPRIPGGLWFSLGVLSGSTKPDAALADYQWNTTPRGAWGAQALVGAGRFATGVRFWRTQTTQDIGLPGAPAGTTVRWTSGELVGQGRLATLWGNHVMAIASVGRLHLDSDPDRITIDPNGSVFPIVVDFKPVDEWIAGGGVSLKRALGPAWDLGLEFDHRVFGLETAHRNGDVIEVGRQSFGDWSARLELAWLYRRR